MEKLDFSEKASLYRLFAVDIEEPADFPMTRAEWHSEEEERLLLKIYTYGCPVTRDEIGTRVR